MAANVASDLAATRGVAHERGVSQIEGFDYGPEVVGITVHVVVGRSLAGAAMAPAIERDAAVAVMHEEQHLTVPRVGIERPAVRKCDDRTSAPILVVDFGAVFGGDCRHCAFLFRGREC